MQRSRTILLVAFHFPPVKGSSGVQRTLRFAQHLPKYGWRPIVLTIDPRAYGAVSQAIGNEIPAGLEVHRAFGLDVARSLSLFGRYPRALALPDRWAIWRIWAVRKALRILGSTRVDAIWSTFPIATAHRIGLDLALRTGLPWVAEFRDPLWQGDYPPEPRVNRAWQDLEREIFARANAVVVATPGAVSLYSERFPRFGADRIELIENGYDEETFQRAGSSPPRAPGGGGPVRLLHSGLIYPSERDPTHLFEAVATLKRAGRISAERLRILLRASGNEADYRTRLAALRIEDIVQLEPAIDYLPALQEMLSVDGLLILQAANCNQQVPAKLYEYLRAQRPILALTDAAGDTARTLTAAGTGLIAPLDSAEQIAAALVRFMEEIEGDGWRRAPDDVIAGYSREAQTGRLARLLDTLIGQAGRAHG
jgi:glycosyltransferase involved in cell wall biosynthesis